MCGTRGATATAYGRKGGKTSSNTYIHCPESIFRHLRHHVNTNCLFLCPLCCYSHSKSTIASVSDRQQLARLQGMSSGEFPLLGVGKSPVLADQFVAVRSGSSMPAGESSFSSLAWIVGGEMSVVVDKERRCVELLSRYDSCDLENGELLIKLWNVW